MSGPVKLAEVQELSGLEIREKRFSASAKKTPGRREQLRYLHVFSNSRNPSREFSDPRDCLRRIDEWPNKTIKHLCTTIVD